MSNFFYLGACMTGIIIFKMEFLIAMILIWFGTIVPELSFVFKFIVIILLSVAIVLQINSYIKLWNLLINKEETYIQSKKITFTLLEDPIFQGFIWMVNKQIKGIKKIFSIIQNNVNQLIK